jgi:hypothetical protein
LLGCPLLASRMAIGLSPALLAVAHNCALRADAFLPADGTELRRQRLGQGRKEWRRQAFRTPHNMRRRYSLWGVTADRGGSLPHGDQEAPALLARPRPQMPDRRAS